MLIRLLFTLFFVLSAYTSYGQAMWNNINLPADLNSSISCIASNGSDVLLGTSSQGVYVSNDSGLTWKNNSTKNMITYPINFLLISPNGYVFAVGPVSVYRSPMGKNQWTELTSYSSKTGTIQCAAVSSIGSIALGTNQGVNVSSSKNNGDAWIQVTNQMGSNDVKSIIINLNEQIFFSTIYKKNATIFISDMNGGSLNEITKKITETPLVTDFTMDPKGNVFAAVESSIYQYDDANYTWNQLTNTGKEIIGKLKASGSNYLIAVCDALIKIFDREKKNWIKDIPDFTFSEKIVDVAIDINDRISVITQNTLAKTPYNISVIVSMGTSKNFTVYDAKGVLMADRTFALYKATCDNNQDFIDNIKTNSSGVFSLNYFATSLHAGDQIKLEQLVYTEGTTKSGHEEFGNKIRDIYLNNMEYDTVGNTKYYSLTESDNQTIKMEHTIIHAFLIISVEWDAKPEYLENLKKCCSLMSEFLYDVTDGQLFVEAVAIYDNKQKWDQADIQIHADNMTWPNAIVDGIHFPDIFLANVRLPRRFLGNKDADRNTSNTDDWYQFDDALNSSLPMSSTMAHELGHYMLNFYDEYVWTIEAMHQLHPDSHNFGFMNDQYQNNYDWSSEMSTPERYSNPNYRFTLQWFLRGSDCWTQFKHENQRELRSSVDNVLTYLPIKMPSERTLSPGRNFLIGPSDFNYGIEFPTRTPLNCKIAPLVTVNVHDQNTSAGDVKFTIYDDTRLRVANADVSIGGIYLFPRMSAGKSADNGRIIIPGGHIGEHYYITFWKDGPFWPIYYAYESTVNTIYGTKTGNDIPLAEEVHLAKMSGDYRIIPSVKFDGNGNFNLNLTTNKAFNSVPDVNIMTDSKTVKKYNMSYDNKLSVYNTTLSSNINEGFMLLNMLDSINKSFPVLFNYQVSNFRNNVFAPNGAGELILDSNNKSIKFIASLSSRFAPLKNGIPKNAKQGGEVISFSATPANLTDKTTNFINIRYSRDYLTSKEEASLSIYKWDESNLKWVLIPGSIDTAHQIVTAPIKSDGTYAAFATYITAGVNDDNELNYFGLDVFPNPINTNSRIEFFMPESGLMSLSLFNSLGTEILTIDKSYLDYGKHSYNLNAANLESGVYYIKLAVDGKLATKKIVIIK